MHGVLFTVHDSELVNVSGNTKPHVLQSTVHYWGSGILLPIKLHLPTTDTDIKQVSLGRTQKAAVTKNGKLLIWEVNPLQYFF